MKPAGYFRPSGEKTLNPYGVQIKDFVLFLMERFTIMEKLERSLLKKNIILKPPVIQKFYFMPGWNMALPLF